MDLKLDAHADRGSSPRERGTPVQLVARHFDRRFIPARAGNTNGQVIDVNVHAVHPRASGEHFLHGTPSF